MASLVITICGVVALIVILSHWAVSPWRRARRNRQPVRLEGLAALYSERSGNKTVAWFQLRVTNHAEATVLTDWGVTLVLDSASYTGSHNFNEPLVEGMKDLPPLDQITATDPFHGDRIGWVAFRVDVPHADILANSERGLPTTAVVTVQNSRGSRSEVTIDLLQLWQESHQSFTAGDSYKNHPSESPGGPIRRD